MKTQGNHFDSLGCRDMKEPIWPLRLLFHRTALFISHLSSGICQPAGSPGSGPSYHHRNKQGRAACSKCYFWPPGSKRNMRLPPVLTWKKIPTKSPVFWMDECFPLGFRHVVVAGILRMACFVPKSRILKCFVQEYPWAF